MASETQTDGVTQLLTAAAGCVRALVGLSPGQARVVLRYVAKLLGASNGDKETPK